MTPLDKSWRNILANEEVCFESEFETIEKTIIPWLTKNIEKCTLSNKEFESTLKKSNTNIDPVTNKSLLYHLVFDLAIAKKSINASMVKSITAEDKEQLLKVFNYNSTLMSRVLQKYLTVLGSTLCFYCNLDYVYNFQVINNSESNEKEYRGAFDHYHPASTHPHLAITLDNLIPVCTMCNSNLKNAKNLELHNVHETSFNSNSRFNYFGFLDEKISLDSSIINNEYRNDLAHANDLQIYARYGRFVADEYNKLTQRYEYHLDYLQFNESNINFRFYPADMIATIFDFKLDCVDDKNLSLSRLRRDLFRMHNRTQYELSIASNQFNYLIDPAVLEAALKLDHPNLRGK